MSPHRLWDPGRKAFAVARGRKTNLQTGKGILAAISSRRSKFACHQTC